MTKLRLSSASLDLEGINSCWQTRSKFLSRMLQQRIQSAATSYPLASTRSDFCPLFCSASGVNKNIKGAISLIPYSDIHPRTQISDCESTINLSNLLLSPLARSCVTVESDELIGLKANSFPFA